MPKPTLIFSASPFEAQIGYSRAVATGSWILVSGTTGYDLTTSPPTISPLVSRQCNQALLNIQSALSQAGASIKDVVRVRYILPNAADFEKCWPVLRDWFGDVRPAATMIQAGLMREEMKIEIEITARLPGREGGVDDSDPL